MYQKSPIKVSIVVVSFDSKKELIKTLKSVNSQTYKNFQIIIVDNLSTDGSKEFLNKNKNLYHKLSRKRDKGIYDGMNKGINLCDGEWILFLNSGDIFFSKNVLKKISKYLISQNHIIYGDTLVNNKKTKYIWRGSAFKNLLFKMPFCHQSVFVQKNILKKYKFDLKYKISSDFDLFYKIFKKRYNFFYSKIIISEVVSGGLSDTKRNEVFKEYKKINQKYSNNIFLIYYDFLICCFWFKKIIRKILGEKLTNFLIKIRYYNKRIG